MVLWKQELMLMKWETKYSKGHWPPLLWEPFSAPFLLPASLWVLTGGLWRAASGSISFLLALSCSSPLPAPESTICPRYNNESKNLDQVVSFLLALCAVVRTTLWFSLKGSSLKASGLYAHLPLAYIIREISFKWYFPQPPIMEADCFSAHCTWMNVTTERSLMCSSGAKAPQFGPDLWSVDVGGQHAERELWWLATDESMLLEWWTQLVFTGQS